MGEDRVYLGQVPAEEEEARPGREDYEQRAQTECSAYIEAIRRMVGAEPDGARLIVSRQERAFGDYFEVVCEYDANIAAAARYAARCDDEAPTTWAAAGMTAPTQAAPVHQAGKRYVGTRTPDECVVVVVGADGSESLLDPRFDLRRHSPDGFNWGYGGSGPAQLALALLGDDQKARSLYQDFKFKVLARIDSDSFELSQEDVLQAVARLEVERGNRR